MANNLSDLKVATMASGGMVHLAQSVISIDVGNGFVSQLQMCRGIERRRQRRLKQTGQHVQDVLLGHTLAVERELHGRTPCAPGGRDSAPAVVRVAQ